MMVVQFCIVMQTGIKLDLHSIHMLNWRCFLKTKTFSKEMKAIFEQSNEKYIKMSFHTKDSYFN